VAAAFDAFQNFKRAIRLHGELIDALELIENAEAFADQLHGDARAARSRFPAAKQEQPRAIQPR